MNEIINLIFSDSEDKFNWVTDSPNPIETVNGNLVLKPGENGDYFGRSLGNIDNAKNRVRLIIDLIVKRPQSSGQNTAKVWFEVSQGSNLIDKFSVYVNDISGGGSFAYNLNRIYKYEDLSGSTNLKIYFENGSENFLELKYLKAYNYSFDKTNLRSYFAIEDFFENALDSVSSAFVLKSFVQDGNETLTAAFFSENNQPGSEPETDWFLAKADLDGSNRVSENGQPNTFNPFISELGLTYANETGNYYGGLPTGTASGSDYGNRIRKMGFDKPSILNLNLNERKAAFFIDCDYSSSFKVVFEVLVNNFVSDVYTRANIYREYTIEFDVEKCSFSYTFKDKLNNDELNDIIQDGFLSGLTPGELTTESVNCSDSIQYEGQEGFFEFLLNLGTDVGTAGIQYKAFDIPDKFEIEYDGQIYSSGFRGSDAYNNALISAGVPQSEINTANPSNGQGILTFTKQLPEPQTAIVRVYAPLGNTGWEVSGICPYRDNFTDLIWTKTQDKAIKTGSASTIEITRSAYVFPVTNVVWQKYNQSNSQWENQGYSINTVTEVSLTNGNNLFRMKAEDDNNVITFSNVLSYIKF